MNNTNDKNKETEEELKEELKSESKEFFESLTNYFKNILNIRDGSDVNGAIIDIKKEIDFKGQVYGYLVHLL